MPSVYLDHAATTPVRPSVAEAMWPWIGGGRFGNASGAHQVARQARAAVDDAREIVAAGLGCRPADVVFTSGGTEADNTAIAGAALGGALVACSAIEHHAVLEPVLAHGGTTVAVDAQGVLDLDRLPANVRLVSVMSVNNEVGTIQPIAELRAAVGPDVVVHTDAVQAVAWLDVADVVAEADLVSVSAHKLGGPQGVGALVVRPGTDLAPLLRGGGQELDRRSGTHDVAGIIGFAEAVRVTVAERAETVARVGVLRDRLVDGLVDAIDGCAETVSRPLKVAGNAHLSIEGIDSESLLVLLDRAGVCASIGASCASGAVEASHVLAAMGRPARGALRLTLGWCSTDDDVDVALDVIPAAVAQLRRQP